MSGQEIARVSVIGGGLAGPEAALMAARRGCRVDLYEMRSVVDGTLHSTPAHQTADFAELVCSNSLKSESENTAPWLLKQEMRFAFSFAKESAGRSMAARIAMMAMTTSNSTRVKA